MRSFMCVFGRVAGAIAGFAIAASVLAQDYPSKPVRVIVPYPPGGVTDIVSRAVADKLSIELGKPFVVENKAGAATTVASNIAAKAEPDGYTLYVATTSLVINPTLQGNVQYDARKDFAPVSLISLSPFVLQVNAAFPARDMKELIALVKANPDKYNIASSGIGAVNHLAAELLKARAGLSMTHVPYKGGAPGGQDLAAGVVQMMFSSTIEAVPHLQSGRTRAIAISSARRSPMLPDLPTVEEAAGLTGFDAVFWQSIVVPAGTPKPIIARLHAAIVKVLADPQMEERFAKLGVEFRSSTPEELAEMIDREEKRWGTLIRERGIKAE